MAKKKASTSSYLGQTIPPIDPDKNLKEWHVFPDSLPTLAGQNTTGKFTGYQLRYDITQNVGAFVAGQNVMMSEAQTPTLRYGYSQIGINQDDSYPVNRGWVFETRLGDQFELKTYNDSVAYYLWGANGVSTTDFGVLLNGLTPALDFGFANIGLLSDTTTHCVFSNGIDGFYRFNGAYGTVIDTSNASGVIQGVNINSEHLGENYNLNDILTVTTGSGTAQVQVTSVASGAVQAISLEHGGEYNQNGFSYQVGDVVNVFQGSSFGGCTVKITAVTLGIVTAVTLVDNGLGYVEGDNLATGGGLGTGLTINITSVSNNGSITGLALINPGTGYSDANNVSVTGGAGTGASVDITNVAQGYIKISIPVIFNAPYDLQQVEQIVENGGFYIDFSTGLNQLQILGVTYTYTGVAGAYFTGINVDPTVIPNGTLVVQKPQKMDGVDSVYELSTVQGNILFALNFRLHAGQFTKPDIWNYSIYGNPFNFSVSVPYVDGTGNSKEVEYGGGIVAFGTLNQKVLAFKRRGITQLTFSQTGQNNDYPLYQTITSSDNKSTSLGAINQKSTFSTPLGLVFVTPDNRMVLLTGVTANGQPQYFYLSDPVAALFTAGSHDTGTGICVDNRLYYSFKQSPQSPFNDIEIQGNMLRQTFDAQGRAIPILWDTPTVGIFCSDYTAIFDSTTGVNTVHRQSSLNSNTYAATTTKTDLNNAFTATVRTWAEQFGQPYSQKKIDECQIEIKMLPNSVIYATLLFNQDGSAGVATYTLRGSETQYIIQAPAVYNPFGAASFGSQMIGSNPQQNQLQRYLFQLEIAPNIEFFNISLQLSTTTENSDFELVRFSYRLVEYMPQIANDYSKNTQ